MTCSHRKIRFLPPPELCVVISRSNESVSNFQLTYFDVTRKKWLRCALAVAQAGVKRGVE